MRSRGFFRPARGWKSLAAGLAVMVLAVGNARAAPWSIDEGQSTISFSGTHAGRPFEGTFKSWSAKVLFDPEDLANSRVDVLVDLASAVTGDTTYDKTLPTSDWFQVSTFAQGRFRAETFSKGEKENDYRAEGTLSLRGIEVPVTLDFTFQPAGQTATLSGTTRLERLAFGIGKESDASGAWVSLEIPVKVDAVMVPAEGRGPQPKS